MTLPNQITQQFMDETNLSLNDYFDIFNDLYSPSQSFADLYCQSHTFQNFSLEDSLIKGCSFSQSSGVGLRVVHQEKVGFSYSQNFSLTALKHQARIARSFFSKDGLWVKPSLNMQSAPQRYPAIKPEGDWSDAQFCEFLQNLDRYCRSIHPDVTQVSLSLASSFSAVMIINDRGRVAFDLRPLMRLDLKIFVEKNGIVETGYVGGGARCRISDWLQNDRAFEMANEAYRQALLNFEAQPAPSGAMEVVLGAGWPGVLLHEAVGHGLEADFNRKQTSIYSGKIGQKIASEHCTVIDDGTIMEARGSLSVDDEGTPTQKTTLIERGVLKGYLFDQQNALLMGTQSTGNGRRESYDALPMPRMTNTYLAPGKHSKEEIIASLKDGIYAVQFGGGSVDITSGQFVFSASEAYRVKNGKILHPIKGATLIGVGPEIMNNISMVGSDWRLDDGIGVCGKNGQQVPVGVGQPTLKIDQIVVGGTDAKHK